MLGRRPRHDGLTEVLGTYRHSEPKRRSDLYLPDPPNAAMFSTPDTAPCHFDRGVRYRLRSRRIVARLWETAWPVRGLEEPPVRKGGDRYVIREADRSRRMLRKSPQDVARNEGWIVRRVMSCDPEAPPKTSP